MAADAGGGGPGDHRAGHDPRSNGTGAVSTVSATIAIFEMPSLQNVTLCSATQIFHRKSLPEFAHCQEKRVYSGMAHVAGRLSIPCPERRPRSGEVPCPRPWRCSGHCAELCRGSSTTAWLACAPGARPPSSANANCRRRAGRGTPPRAIACPSADRKPGSPPLSGFLTARSWRFRRARHNLLISLQFPTWHATCVRLAHALLMPWAERLLQELVR
jgi:hypothetical protein